LIDALAETGSASEGGGELAGLAQWIGVPDEVRAGALVELLQLADAIPTRRAPRELDYPRLFSAVDG
jgi:hypothetical protein